MKPYYDHDGITLFNADCLEVLPAISLPTHSAVITDPPYGIGYRSGFSPTCSWFNRPIRGDDSTWDRDAILAWAAEQNLSWACFGTWKAPPPKDARGALVWDKGPAFGMGDLSLPWKPSWELIFVGGPGWEGKREEGVLRGPCVVSWESKGRCHPNQKPVWLAASLLKKLPRVEAVIDPFCGSGSVLVAAKEAGVRAIGVEVEERYCEMICRRLEQGVFSWGN